MFGGKKGAPREVVIGTPRDLQHNIHVNKDLDWHIRDPDTSFRLEEKLGEGSFGVVYKAMHLDSLHEIAVKIIEVDLSQTMDLQNEISILKKCLHPNIVSYFGSCATEKKLWILMDYCGLGSVRDVMETCKRTLYEKEIACIIAGTLQGLRYLHHHFDQPIIHKDIKAANILLTEQGDVKLADFGVAQQILTTLCLGYLEGTPHFMAPEIGNAARFNFKADIWSLGITAIEMADGRPPYADINIMRAIHMIRRHPPPTLKEPKKWSKEFNDFISRCLVKDFNERASAEDLLKHPFIMNAKPQAMKELCHEALKAKKKARAKLKKELPQFSHTSPSSPPLTSMSRWRTDKKSRSLVVRSTFERGNHGSVVILNTVNVGRRSYHSASDDSSLGTMTSNSSRETKTGNSLSSSSSSYGTVKFHETIMENENENDGDGDSAYGTVRFNESITKGGDDYGTVQFNESINVEGGGSESDSDAAPRLSSRKKRPLSSSLSSLPSPQLLSETDDSHTDAHEGGDETTKGEETKGEETLPKGISSVVKHETPTGTKETRSIGVQTDLPLDLKLFMDSVMRKKRHKHYTETHELKHDYKSRVRSPDAKLGSTSYVAPKRTFLERITPQNKSQREEKRKLSISSSGPDDAVSISPKPKVPPLQNLPLLIDLTASGETKGVKAKSPRTKDSKSPRTPRDSKSPKTPKGSKGHGSESREDPAPSPRKSPRRKFAISEYLGGLFPNVVASPFIGLYSQMDSPSDKEPALRFSSSATDASPLGSSAETSMPTCSPPSSPTASSIDSALDSSLDSLRSSVPSPLLQPITLKIIAEDDEIFTIRDSPYITPYSTTDESSDSAPTIFHSSTPPFALTSPAPFTGPLPCKPQESSSIASLLLSPPLTSASNNFIKNLTPEVTPDNTPENSPDPTPRIEKDKEHGYSSASSRSNTPTIIESVSSALDSAVAEALTSCANLLSPPLTSQTEPLDPGTPRPINPRHPSPLVPAESRILTRVNATSKLGDQVKAAMHSPDDTLRANVELTSLSPQTPTTNTKVKAPSTLSPPKNQAKSGADVTPNRSPNTKHRSTHSAPVLPSPPLKPSAPLHIQTLTPPKSTSHSRSNSLTTSIPKPSTPTSKLTRTVSLRSLVHPNSSDGSPPSHTSFPHNDPTPIPSVNNIKQTLQSLSSSPPKQAALKRTASILNSNVIAAFLPKASPPTSQPTSPAPSTNMVRNLSMAFSVSAENSPGRPRASSASSSPSSPPTIARNRASTVSAITSPLAKPNSPIPKSGSGSLSQATSASISSSPENNSAFQSPTATATDTTAPTSSSTRIPKRVNSHNQPISYATMRQKSSIPLPRSTPRARSATDVTKATLEKPIFRFDSLPAENSSLSTICEPSPVPSSPDIPDSTDSGLSDIPPLSLTPSPPSTPPSSRSPSPESSSPSPRTSPRGSKTEKSPSLLSSTTSRPYNRHSQHALEAAHASAHLRPKSDSSKSSRASPQPSSSPLRRTISSAIIVPPRATSSPSLVSPSSSPTPSLRRMEALTRTTSDSSRSPRGNADKPKDSNSPKDSEKTKLLKGTEKARSPKDTEKSKSPKETEKSPKSEKPLSPKEGFSIRLPGGVKFPSYTPRSPRRSRNSPRSPRSPRPQSVTKKSSNSSPLSSPPLPPFSPEPNT